MVTTTKNNFDLQVMFVFAVKVHMSVKCKFKKVLGARKNELFFVKNEGIL